MPQSARTAILRLVRACQVDQGLLAASEQRAAAEGELKVVAALEVEWSAHGVELPA